MSMKISIHAPARGGDHRPPCVYQEPHHFNPRPREGGRLQDRRKRRGGVEISIHAPARGGDTRKTRLVIPSW